MSTRTSSLLLVLAACGETKTDPRVLAAIEAEQRALAEDDGRIFCARGETALARTCTVERERRDEGLVLTLRQPDGGFRRLLVTGDGRGVIAADGAEPARVRIVGADMIDVALGDHHYRLPATVRGANARP
jgi:hypothetical protein